VNPTTMQDALTGLAADQTALSTDAANIAQDQAKLASDTNQQTTDTTTYQTDTAGWNNALAITGPVAVPTADGKSLIPYFAPGTVIQSGVPIPLASTVQFPAAAPPAAPNP